MAARNYDLYKTNLKFSGQLGIAFWAIAYFFLTVSASVVMMTARNQFLDSDDGGQRQGKLGNDQGLTGQDGEGAESEWNEGAAQQQGNHDVVSVLLVLSATTAASSTLASFLNRTLHLLGSWEFDLHNDSSL